MGIESLKEKEKMDTNQNTVTVTRDAPIHASSWERAQETPSTTNHLSNEVATRGIGQALGLHPIPGILTPTIDIMLFGGTFATHGAIWPLALVVAAVLGRHHLPSTDALLRRR